MNRMINAGKGIIGVREGGAPDNELDNFYECKACGQSVDMRDLGQVFHHDELNHKPIDMDA